MWTGKTARGWGRWWDRVLSLPSPCSPHLPLFLLIFSRSLTSHHTLLSKRLDQASILLIYLSFLDFVWERDMSHVQDRQFYRKVFSLVNNIFQPSFFLNRTLHVLECTSCSCVKLNFLMCEAFNIRDYIRLIEIVKIPWLLPNILYFLVHVFSSLETKSPERGAWSRLPYRQTGEEGVRWGVGVGDASRSYPPKHFLVQPQASLLAGLCKQENTL